MMKEFAIIHEHGQVPDSLRSVPFLGSFGDEELDDVLNSSSYIQCEPGDKIIEEGTIDSRIYILLSGVVAVNKDGKDLTYIRRPGEVFGEMAVVNQERRSTNVVAVEETVCLAVDQKFLQDIKPRDEYPAFYAAMFEFIARVTAGRLQATSRRLAEVEMELNALKEKLGKKAAPTVKAKAVVKARPLAKPRPAVKAKPLVAAKAKRKPTVKVRRASVAKAKRR
jgi:CRP-like cAMP-binding protein